jgi:hypothetical protein
MKITASKVFAFCGLLVIGQAAFASDFGDADIDPKFRAKIVKEKAHQASLQSEMEKNKANGQNPDAECGSQSIGNVNTNGKPGSAPREIFVFAPNSINVVSGRGCGN